MKRDSDHVNIIKGVGCYDLRLTDEHPVYVYKENQFVWIKTKNLTISDNIVYNINTKNVRVDCTNNELWILGRYCADGYMENHAKKRPILCIEIHKKEEFEEHLEGIEYTLNHFKRSCLEYEIKSEKISTLLDQFGTGSTKKEIPNWVIDLPKDQLQYFMNGYLSGKGYNRNDGKMRMFWSTSEKLFLGLQEIIIKLYNVVPTVGVRNTYTAQYPLSPIKQKVVGDKIIVPIKSIERVENKIEVFNFEVETDNSYTVGNVIVHNCQDISVAGKQRGFEHNGERTRSGLFFDALRIIEGAKPKVAICENVKNLTGKKFKEQFKIVLDSLENAGYVNYWKVLNAKHYGVPQNRERVFIVSIRKDIDRGFEFPDPFELTIKLEDVIDVDVPESFYLSEEQIKRLTGNTFNQANTRLQKKDICDTLCARDYKDPKCVQVAQIYPNSGNPQAGRIYDPVGISPSLDTCQGGNRQVKIVVNGCDIRPKDRNYKKNGRKRLDQIESRNEEIANSLLTTSHHNMVEIKIVAMRGRNPNNPSDRTSGAPTKQRLEINQTGCSNALTTVQKDNLVLKQNYIRKLTPKESWRLMGFNDDEFAKAEAVCSNTQLYKQAGNSIVVDVLVYLFKQLLNYVEL